MRSYPIDANRVRLISTGTVKPVIRWVELSDGSRRPDPTGRPEVDHRDLPLWDVEAIAPADQDDDRDKTGVVLIRVASKDVPEVGGFGELLVFEDLFVTPGYLSRKTGQITPANWSAGGLRKPGAQARPQPSAA